MNAKLPAWVMKEWHEGNRDGTWNMWQDFDHSVPDWRVILFTVFGAEELRDAQAHPEKYENLQVRVCGWNVRWNDLCKAEQDAYISRAENLMKGW